MSDRCPVCDREICNEMAIPHCDEKCHRGYGNHDLCVELAINWRAGGGMKDLIALVRSGLHADKPIAMIQTGLLVQLLGYMEALEASAARPRSCPVCDRERATAADLAAYPEGAGAHLCWRNHGNPHACDAHAVDWRARALAAEAALRSLLAAEDGAEDRAVKALGDTSAPTLERES